jgi:AraC-like DNA-binding protein
MEGSDYPSGENANDDTALDLSTPLAHREGQGESLPYEKIASLLQQHCVDTQLYLQHNLNISQLAQTLGTNRTYLSKYFAMQGITYNAYINDLRICHFVRLYREAVATLHFFTVQKLASQSGYHSYNTFALAFKQRMGKSVTEWKLET